MFDATSPSMKVLPKKLIPLTLFAIVVTSLFSVQPAQAYMVTLDQVGSNTVVATGSGAINLTGLTLSSSGGFATPGVHAAIGNILMGSGGPLDAYTGFTGPTNFGSGGTFPANSNTGNVVGINASAGLLSVPQGYPGGADLGSSSITFNSATIHSLGLMPGTYVWSWGTGLPNQNFTLVIGAAPAPDGGSTVSLLGFALLGLAALRRKLSC